MALDYTPLQNQKTWEKREKEAKNLQRFQKGILIWTDVVWVAVFTFAAFSSLGVVKPVLTYIVVAVLGSTFTGTYTFFSSVVFGPLAIYPNLSLVFHTAKKANKLKGALTLDELAEMSNWETNNKLADRAFESPNDEKMPGSDKRRLLLKSFVALLPVFAIISVVVLPLIFSNPVTTGLMIAAVVTAGVHLLTIAFSLYLDKRALNARREAMEALAEDLGVTTQPAQSLQEVSKQIDQAMEAKLSAQGALLKKQYQENFQDGIHAQIERIAAVLSENLVLPSAASHTHTSALNDAIDTLSDTLSRLKQQIETEHRAAKYLTVDRFDQIQLAKRMLTPEYLVCLIKKISTCNYGSENHGHLLKNLGELLITIYPEKIPEDLAAVLAPLADDIFANHAVVARILFTAQDQIWKTMRSQDKLAYTPRATAPSGLPSYDEAVKKPDDQAGNRSARAPAFTYDA